MANSVHFLLLIFFPVFKLKNLYVPWAFPVGPSVIPGVVCSLESFDYRVVVHFTIHAKRHLTVFRVVDAAPQNKFAWRELVGYS
jgi:hypothetical protein